ncbi:hypothetical protein ARMSODRAFT_895744, partial [Armillaria solidipes]
WVAACDKLKIKITADAAEAIVATYRESQGQEHKNTPSAASNVGGVPAFSLEAFVDALVAFIAANDQSFNVIESPELHRIFLMLREELTDADIPHRTQIRSRVMEIWEEHLKQLSREMQVSFLHIVDRLCIALKMGWISLDNASNNDTMLAWLETLLTQRGIPFDALKRHIR